MIVISVHTARKLTQRAPGGSRGGAAHSPTFPRFPSRADPRQIGKVEITLLKLKSYGEVVRDRRPGLLLNFEQVLTRGKVVAVFKTPVGQPHLLALAPTRLEIKLKASPPAGALLR